MKFCNKCQRNRKEKFFGKNFSRKDGLQAYCKECSMKMQMRYYKENREELKKKQKMYNLWIYWPQFLPKDALKAYRKLLRNQKQKCAICAKSAKEIGTLAVDHCHKTGQVRGLLCNKCNRALGYFEDNISFLKAAIGYLKK